MPEILTESFCERCGTRYTFESNAPRGKGIGRFRTLSKGLKNFVLSDDSSLDEALAAARSDVEREAVSQQLDAFHKTFNFCMTCRQYTCSNCWNETEGRCLTCAPGVGRDLGPSAFPQLELNGNGAHAEPGTIEGMAWPTVDLRSTEPTPAPAEDVWPEDDAATTSDLAARLAALGVAPADEDLTDAPVARASAIEDEVAPAPEVEAADVAAVDDALEPAPDIAARLAALGMAPAEEAGPADVAPAEELVVQAAVDEPAADVAPAEEPIDVAAGGDDRAAAEVEAPVETIEADGDLADAEPYFAPDPEPVAEPAATAAPTQPDGEMAPVAPSPAVEEEPELEAPVLADVRLDAEAFASQPQPIAAEREQEVAAGDEPPLAALPSDDAAAAAAAAQTAALLRRFRPGQSIDEALAAFEAGASAGEPAASMESEPEPVALEPEPVAAVEPLPVLDGFEPDLVIVAEPETTAAVEPERVLADVEPEPEPVVAAGPERVLTQAEPAVTEPEPETVAVGEPEPQPVQAAPKPEPVDVAEPEPAAAAPEPEPVAAAPEPETAPPARPVPAPQPPAAPREDRVEVPAWRIVAPDAPAAADGHPAPSEPAIPIAATAEPQWPTIPEWPTTPNSESDALAFLTAKLTRSADDVWSASNREVLSAAPAAEATPAVQACVSCGLSLSATARFCRRCGTRQG